MRTLEKHDEVRKREQSACMLVQSTLRLWHARHRRRAAGTGVRRCAAGSHSKRGNSGSNADEDPELARLIAAQREATKNFKHARHVHGRVTHVHNIAVLHDSVDALRIDQQRLASKLDAVVRATANTAKCVQALQSSIQRLR